MNGSGLPNGSTKISRSALLTCHQWRSALDRTEYYPAETTIRRLCIRVFVVIVGKIKRPVVFFSERRIRRASGFSSLIHGTRPFWSAAPAGPASLLLAAKHHCDFGNIRWIAKNDVFRVSWGHGTQLRQPVSCFCRSHTRPDRHG